jgi:radical SAM protein with 4Fe4S-binding SPASM domain
LGAPPIEEVSLGEFLEEAGAYARRIPLEGTIETTFRCNLNCVHCYVNEPASARAVREQELSLERLKELIDEIVDEGCLDLLFTGGEVLLRPDFPELYLHAVSRGLRVSIYTNGTLVTERVAELFAAHPPALVEITLYGMTRETYERVTRVAGSFDRCLEGIRRLHERGLPLKLKTMVLTWNEHEVAAMREFARSLGVAFRHDSLLNPRVDCGAHRDPGLQVSPERAVAVDLEDPVRRTAYQESYRRLSEAEPDPHQGENVYACGAGQIGFTVDPYGHLQLCQLSRRRSFDLKDDSFARGWHEFFPALRARKWQSNAVCRRCDLRPVCGSCPGAAEMETGDIEGVVPQFCEITHLRTYALLGEASGHRQDASCCLGEGSRAKGTVTATAGGCGSCAAPPTETPLLQIQRRRPEGARARGASLPR